ncbi:MAG: hypothetical protein PHY23_06130 [Oscillospiraceae bacterium]|nr:hypothetical protein [Oscillospiraceae bacterium]
MKKQKQNRRPDKAQRYEQEKKSIRNLPLTPMGYQRKIKAIARKLHF